MNHKRKEMLDLRHILRLKEKGYSNRQIASVLGAARKTINGYVRQFKASGKSYKDLAVLTDEALWSLVDSTPAQANPRYEVLCSYFPKYEQELKKVGVTKHILWEQYHQAHPDGYSYAHFCFHLRSHFKKEQVSLHCTHHYGDKLFIDFAGKKLPVIDKLSGEVVWKEVFVAVLGGSGYTYVQAVESQKLDDFIAVVQDCLHFFGGVPRALVVDNLKSAVSKANDYEADINRNFKALALHYDTVVLATRARKPKDKALVEGAVKLVYQRIYYPLNELQFFSLSDLNRAINEQLAHYNNREYKSLKCSRRDLFEQHEKGLLEPLPTARFERRTQREGRINKDAHVQFDYHYYSVPHAHIGKRIFVQATQRVVEVFISKTHERIAVHQRSYQRGKFSTISEHLPDNVRFVKDWSVEQFSELAQQIGQATHQFFLNLFEHKAHPEQAYKACMGILSLRKAFSDARINAACQRADYFQNYSYQTIKNILEKGLDRVPYRANAQSDSAGGLDVNHPNIRGGDYYK